MQEASIALDKWLCRKVLRMHISVRRARRRLENPDCFLQRVRGFKYLSLVLDENLSFNQHIDVEKIYSVCF